MDFLKIISALFNSTNLEVNENEFMYFNSRYFIKLCQLFRATTSKNIGISELNKTLILEDKSY